MIRMSEHVVYMVYPRVYRSTSCSLKPRFLDKADRSLVDRRGCGTTVFSSMRIIRSSISQLNFLGLLCSLDAADVQRRQSNYKTTVVNPNGAN